MSFAKHHFRKEKNVTRVSRRVFFCVCVGLRQNRAAEMQQPLQIFLLAGWQRRAGAKPRWRKTTKRRIRLALEPPQIFSPPPPFNPLLVFSLFSFSSPPRSVARCLLCSGSDSIWQHSYPSVNLSMSLFRYDLMEMAGRNMAPETMQVLARCFVFFFSGHHLVLCSSWTLLHLPSPSTHPIRSFFKGCRIRILVDLIHSRDTIASGVTSTRHGAHVPP